MANAGNISSDVLEIPAADLANDGKEIRLGSAATALWSITTTVTSNGSVEIKDLPLVMEIYDYARAFMRATGNTTQWIDGYPSEALICQEIEDGHSFVCTGEQGEILGTFCFILGEDPTYQQIYEGAWLNDEPYGVIHRLATNGKQKGVSEACLDWCFERWPNVRVEILILSSIESKMGW